MSVCNAICIEDLAHITTLVTYQRPHADENLYVCIMCNKALAQGGNLRSRERNRTREKHFFGVIRYTAFHCMYSQNN